MDIGHASVSKVDYQPYKIRLICKCHKTTVTEKLNTASIWWTDNWNNNLIAKVLFSDDKVFVISTGMLIGKTPDFGMIEEYHKQRL